LRSITQKQKRPPFIATKSEARNEINGGEVRPTTTLKRRNVNNRNAQVIRKLPKLRARCNFVSLPKESEGTR